MQNAAYWGPPKMVKYLIQAGADVQVGEIGTRLIPSAITRVRA